MTDRSEIHAVGYLCNILDEKTKAKRAIVYDSPAAAKKVFDVCKALQSRFKRVYVITLARGQQRGRRQIFSATTKNISGIPVLYCQFSPIQILTYLISSLSMLFLIWRVIRQNRNISFHLIAYNRNWLYVPSLVLARFLGAKCYLDLEDGVLVETYNAFAKYQYTVLKFAFDFLCCHGSILVMPSLYAQVHTQNNVVCYGVAKPPVEKVVNNWNESAIRFLLGGSLMRETGISLFMDAVKILNQDYYDYKGTLIIYITGYGTMSDELAIFSQSVGNGWIDYRGRVSKEEYENLLVTSHAGLCLKLPSSEMGLTTFPSKVIEIATQGKLVLTTKLGHVSELLGVDGAIYINEEDPLSLAEAIISVVTDRALAMNSAYIGQQRVLEKCKPEKVVDDIFRLLVGDKT